MDRVIVNRVMRLRVIVYALQRIVPTGNKRERRAIVIVNRIIVARVTKVIIRDTVGHIGGMHRGSVTRVNVIVHLCVDCVIIFIVIYVIRLFVYVSL